MQKVTRCALALLVGAGVVACRDTLQPSGPSTEHSPQLLPMVAGAGVVGLELVAEGLTAPVSLTHARDASRRLFVVDQAGLIRVITPAGGLLPEPFLDLRADLVPLGAFGPGTFDERGLLGLAFHPQYPINGRFFVYYSVPRQPGAPADFNHTSRISEFRVSSDPNRADRGSERVLFEIHQPQFNHNGGSLQFGPDGYLYIALGDGGGANDNNPVGHTPGLGNGQDITNRLGSILRIDVDGPAPYGIPSDNPFVGQEGRDEIFAYGLRNPFRMSFDMGGTRDLFVGDVGQHLWEEVNIVRKGGNYGWNRKEGTHCFDPDSPFVSPPTCPDVGPRGEPLIDPILEYPNSRGQPGVGLGLAVIGGYVYRGSAIPQLQGRYVFGDWSAQRPVPDGVLFVASPTARDRWLMRELRISTTGNGRLGEYLLGFGQDPSGELYVLTSGRDNPTGTTGRVYRMVRPDRRP